MGCSMLDTVRDPFWVSKAAVPFIDGVLTTSSDHQISKHYYQHYDKTKRQRYVFFRIITLEKVQRNCIELTIIVTKIYCKIVKKYNSEICKLSSSIETEQDLIVFDLLVFSFAIQQ